MGEQATIQAAHSCYPRQASTPLERIDLDPATSKNKISDVALLDEDGNLQYQRQHA